MKCPICGQELRPGKKDPNYLLCYNCKKKFKVPQKKVQRVSQEEEQKEQKYSNIPPEKVRKKREMEMRKAYDEMLAVEEGKGKKKKAKRKEAIEDDYDIEDEEEKMSKAPIIILGLAIVIVAGLIVFMLVR